MKKIKVLIGFSKMQESQFFFKACNIKTCMTGNANFPAPDPAPDTLTEIFDDYSALLNKGRDCTRVETAIKQELRKNITSALQKWGVYVEETSNDRSILLTSGFDLSKEKTAIGPLPAPEKLTAEKGLVSGSLKAKVKPVSGSRCYSFEIKNASVQDDSWQSFFSTKSSYIFTGLMLGTQYLVRVCAKGAHPACAYTEPLSVWAS